MSMDDKTEQLGFHAMLADAASENRDRVVARETAHLPDTMADAVPYLRNLIHRHHDAMLAAHGDDVRRLRRDANRLAVKLNGGDRGTLAHDRAPGRVLARETAACAETVPLWGQAGSFIIDVSGLSVRIETEGFYGLGIGWGFWSGFRTHAVDPGNPFLSETGYRSFLGIHANPAPGHTPDSFAATVIETYVMWDLRGKLVDVHSKFRR